VHELTAYDGNTGNIVWTQHQYDVLGSPTVYKNNIYTGDVNTSALTFNATTGDLTWSIANGITQQNAAIADGMVFNGGESHRCYAADAVTGVQKWAISSQGKKPTGSPTVWNHLVIVGESDYNLYAYSEDDGSVAWFTSATGFFGSGVVENNTLYINNNNGHLYALDPATGANIWSYTGLSGVDCTVANGVLYGAGNDGYLYALNARTGAVEWKFKTGGTIGAAPCVQDEDGNMYYCGASGGHN
jgi:glucose dehydrogenase